MAVVQLEEEREVTYTTTVYLVLLLEGEYQGGKEFAQVGTSLVVEGSQAGQTYQAEVDYHYYNIRLLSNP